MLNLRSQSPTTACVPPQIKTSHGVLQKDSLPLQATQSPSSSSSRISPAVLFIIVILAVIFFVSGLLHLLVRFLIRKNPPSSSSSSHSNRQNQEISSSDALQIQTQLQQLFHLHDSGLDQAFIDALPVFLYREIAGSFDCAVCLCEFSQDDGLRLLPACGHAFHLNCIDTWLLSNSTCPLCRGELFVQGIENPVFDFEEEGRAGDRGEAEEIGVGSEKRVVAVRLGKFRNTSNRDDDDDDDPVGAVDTNGNSKIFESSNLDARRCYSMGSSYQYVVGDENLRVALTIGDGRCGEGKRLGAGSKGESFSVSKIWLWANNKGKFPVAASDASSLDGGGLLPWMMPRRNEVHCPLWMCQLVLDIIDTAMVVGAFDEEDLNAYWRFDVS